jgi:hypothetical protein
MFTCLWPSSAFRRILAIHGKFGICPSMAFKGPASISSKVVWQISSKDTTILAEEQYKII